MKSIVKFSFAFLTLSSIIAAYHFKDENIALRTCMLLSLAYVLIRDQEKVIL